MGGQKDQGEIVRIKWNLWKKIMNDEDFDDQEVDPPTRKLRFTKRPQYYYHLTTKKWGKEKWLRPQVEGRKRDILEPKVARICVCPTVRGCLSAVSFYKQIVYIHRTKRRVKATYPYGVVDSYITGEKWIVRPTIFVRVGFLSLLVINKLDFYDPGFGDPNRLEDQREYAEFVSKALSKFKKVPTNFHIDWI